MKKCSILNETRSERREGKKFESYQLFTKFLTQMHVEKEKEEKGKKVLL
jgi:arginyl-tRNA--protein-N-Asp/Glu arginylyltransferase